MQCVREIGVLHLDVYARYRLLGAKRKLKAPGEIIPVNSRVISRSELAVLNIVTKLPLLHEHIPAPFGVVYRASSSVSPNHLLHS